MFGNKKAFLIDLDRGIVGTFVEQSAKSSTEPGYVYIEYVPLNSLKKVKYVHPVRKECIRTVRPTSDAPGVEKEIVIVYEGGDNNMIDFLKELNVNRIKELEDQISDLQIALASKEQEAIDAHSGASKNLRRIRELNKTEKDKDGLGGLTNPELMNEF